MLTFNGPGRAGDAVEAGDRNIAERRSRSDTSPALTAQLADAVAWGDRPPLRRMRLRKWRSLVRNTLRGFADVELPCGLQVDDIAVHVRGGRAWASLSARPMLNAAGRLIVPEGKPQYATILRWRNHALGGRFSAAIVELVRAANPGALDGSGQ
jgi:hypothetical protein